MTEFFDNSSAAVTMRVGRGVGERKYPWDTVPAGKSFAVVRDDIKFSVLRSLASRTGKKLGRKFRVVDHGSGPYEVAHLVQTEAEVVVTSGTLIEALNKIKKENEE